MCQCICNLIFTKSNWIKSLYYDDRSCPCWPICMSVHALLFCVCTYLHVCHIYIYTHICISDSSCSCSMHLLFFCYAWVKTWVLKHLVHTCTTYIYVCIYIYIYIYILTKHHDLPTHTYTEASCWSVYSRGSPSVCSFLAGVFLPRRFPPCSILAAPPSANFWTFK